MGYDWWQNPSVGFCMAIKKQISSFVLDLRFMHNAGWTLSGNKQFYL